MRTGTDGLSRKRVDRAIKIPVMRRYRETKGKAGNEETASSRKVIAVAGKLSQINTRTRGKKLSGPEGTTFLVQKEKRTASRNGTDYRAAFYFFKKGNEEMLNEW